MNSFPEDKLDICTIHNLRKEFFIIGQQNQEKKQVCRLCISQSHGIIHYEQVQESTKEINQKVGSQNNENSTILSQFILLMVEFKEGICKYIESIIDELNKKLSESKNEIEQITTKIQLKDDILKQYQEHLDKYEKFQTNIKQQLEQLYRSYGIDKLQQTLSKLDLKNVENEKEQNKEKINEEAEVNSNQKQIQIKEVLMKKKFKYELIKQPFILQEFSRALTFNKNDSIVAAGCHREIIIYEFKNEQLKQIQVLQGIEDATTTLLFTKKSNQLISGSSNGQIYIWSQNNKNQWIINQTLNQHKNQINCVILNQNEELMISGSDDKSIKFWKFNNLEWKLDLTINCSNEVKSLSLNDSNTKLISSELNKSIQIYERKENKWIKNQKIDVENYGCQLCFISDNEFAFISFIGKKIYFYKQNQKEDKFSKNYIIEVQGIFLDSLRFPLKLIKSQNLLIVKNIQFINILKKQENNSFIIEQSIPFLSEYSSGNISEDGQFLITWDIESKEYKIRKLKEII